MNFTIAKNEDVSYLDKLLFDENKLIKVIKSEDLANVEPQHLIIWANKNGIYTFPTLELIYFLKETIGERSAIEICAGFGTIGRALRIPITDSYIQTTPEMVAYYKLYKQNPISPPKDVQKFEANEAVDYFKPDCVVGCYVTQKYIPSDEGRVNSSLYGVDELTLLPKIKCYINVGNSSSHHDKRIRNFPHTVYRFPWLFTRSQNPKENEISIWKV